MQNSDASSNTLRHTCHSTAPSSDPSRWSDVIPPQSALAFGFEWDQEDEMIDFSGADVLDHSPDTLGDFYLQDLPVSEMQSLNDPSRSTSQRSTTCYDQNMKDHQDQMCTSFSMEQRSLRGMTQTSSTLGGLDVYLKGAQLSRTHRHQPVYSVLDFSNDSERRVLQTMYGL
ncbi:hypothetical protein B0H34DRAFT_726765 [Crassisporium funariophilum]|nr:hypothetical protein B0H34DRAFT_726765 [Crassisporium funariophilum]